MSGKIGEFGWGGGGVAEKNMTKRSPGILRNEGARNVNPGIVTWGPLGPQR